MTNLLLAKTPSRLGLRGLAFPPGINLPFSLFSPHGSSLGAYGRE